MRPARPRGASCEIVWTRASEPSRLGRPQRLPLCYPSVPRSANPRHPRPARHTRQSTLNTTTQLSDSGRRRARAIEERGGAALLGAAQEPPCSMSPGTWSPAPRRRGRWGGRCRPDASASWVVDVSCLRTVMSCVISTTPLGDQYDAVIVITYYTMYM